MIDTEFQLIVYLIWFFALYLFPAFVFSRQLRIAPELINLEGVNFLPVYNSNNNVIAIHNDFDKFMKNNAKFLKAITLKILKIMCDDAKSGNKKRAEYYLFKYKRDINNFTGYLLLGSFIPLVILLIKGIPASHLLLPQIICVFLVIFIYKLFIYHNYETFYDIFYRNWYDKILNFDLIAVNHINQYIQKDLNIKQDSELTHAVQALIETDRNLVDALIESSNKITDKLNVFAGQDSITPESIAKLLDNNLNNISTLNTNMNDICNKANGVMTSLINITEKKNFDIDAINKNTAALLELKKLFASYRNKELTAEIVQLQKISGCLEHNIGDSFNIIGQTAKDNAQKMTEAYNNFYEICGHFTDVLEKDYDTKTAASMQSISDSILCIEEVLKSLDNSTRQLNEAFDPGKSSVSTLKNTEVQKKTEE